MLLDKYLLNYNFNEVHDVVLYGKPEDIYPIIRSINLRKSNVINILFGIRFFFKRKENEEIKDVITLNDFLNYGFILLDEIEDKEFVYGIVGKFWNLKGHVQNIEPDKFIYFNNKGYAKAAWNFVLNELDNGLVRLTTETRIICYGRFAFVMFFIYWMLILPFSSIIRRIILNLIKNEIESKA